MTRRPLLYGLLALAGIATVWLAWHNARQAPYDRVLDLMAAGEFAEAATALEALLAAEGPSPLLLSDLGFAYFSDRRYPEAIRALEQALALPPTADRSRRRQDRLYLARAYLYREQPEPAAATVLTALAAEPVPAPDLRAALALVTRQLPLDRLEAVLRATAPALAENPDLLLLLGGMAEEANQPEAAAAYYRRAMAAAPADPAPVVQLGRLHWSRHQFEEAEAVLTNGLARHPTSAPLHEILGQVYLMTRRTGECLEAFQAAARHDPGSFTAQYMLGRIYEALEDETAAARHFEAALTLDPNRLDLRAYLDQVRRRQAAKQLPPRFTLTVTLQDPEGALGQPRLAGNWTAEGTWDEVAGWQRRPLTRTGDGGWTLQVELPRWDRFFYQALLFDEAGAARHQVRFPAPAAATLTLAWEATALNLTPLPSVTPSLRGGPGDGRRRLLVVILDGGSWVLLRPLLERGAVPHLQALAAEGVMAPLFSPDPSTSRALDHLTRFTRETDFTLKDWLLTVARQVEGFAGADPVPVRRLTDFFAADEPAIWEFLTRNHQSGVSLIFSDVWGFQAEDLLAFHGDGSRTQLPVPAPATPVTPEAIRRRFVTPVPGAPRDDSLEALLRDGVQQGEAKTALAERQWRESDPDLLLLRYATCDLLSHRLWDTTLAHRRADQPAEAAGAAYGATLERVYAFYDELIGRLLQQLDGDDTVLITSDHGMATSFRHDEIGILIAHGPGIRSGAILPTQTLRDLPPTLCYLLETPFPDRADHRVIQALFTPAFLQAHPVAALFLEGAA